MKQISLSILMLLLFSASLFAEGNKVQNRPYTDLRPFHFGVLVGTHFQDIEFQNLGPQQIANEQGVMEERTVTVDQDRWDMGFTVGVLGEARITQNLAFRLAPAMYFGTKHLTFHNFSEKMESGAPLEKTQDLKTIYVSSAMDMIFAAPRLNNTRPYIMAGLNPMLNLSGSDSDYVKLKRFDCFLEMGLGCDFYLPFFKLRPELKFCLGLTDSLDKNHVKNIKDQNMLQYTNSVKKAKSKMICLTFYFE